MEVSWWRPVCKTWSLPGFLLGDPHAWFDGCGLESKVKDNKACEDVKEAKELRTVTLMRVALIGDTGHLMVWLCM